MNTAIVALSGGIKKNGKLPFFVRARLDRAYYLYHQLHPNYMIVCGKWDLLLPEALPVTEAEAMASYLFRLGLSKEKLLLEKKSQDLISSLYYIYIEFVIPLKIRELYIVTSHFQKERAEYIIHKIMNNSVKTHFFSVHSALDPKILWEFFTHERNAFLSTKIFLSKMKPGNYEFLTHRFYNAPFYSSSSRENPQKIVYENRLGKKSLIHRHYSLYKIFRTKQKLFVDYKLTESKFHRGSKVDFWSGRFLPFVGRSENKTIHVLKFALLQKDKKTFENEIKITQFLHSKGVLFAPTIIAHNTVSAPIWYLYKAMPGKIAGRFSQKFSFEEEFYRDYTLNGCIRHLNKLRSLHAPSFPLPKWNRKKYEEHFLNYFKFVEKYDSKLANSTTLQEAKKYFLGKAALFDKAPLFLSHNDLHPANILISPRSNKVHFIDFEHVALNAIAFDFCFLYVFSWDNAFFQQKLYSAFRKSLTKDEKESFDRVFYPTYCCFLIWLLSFVFTWEGRADKERFQKARMYVVSELKRIVKYNLH
jgi:thiamine kinase-like enzyme